MGLARLGRFHVEPDLAAGRLVPVLEAYDADDRELIHAVFASHEHMAGRIRAFVDFLAERMREPQAVSGSPPLAR
jgi:DNA-binding transcriptional LysR family regulator